MMLSTAAAVAQGALLGQTMHSHLYTWKSSASCHAATGSHEQCCSVRRHILTSCARMFCCLQDTCRPCQQLQVRARQDFLQDERHVLCWQTCRWLQG